VSEKFATVFLAPTSEDLDVCENDKLGSTFWHFTVCKFILNRSVNKCKSFWNGCCLLCVIFKHWKLKTASKLSL